MSSISLSLKMMLAASACAGLTLLACGGDDSGGGSTNNDDDETASKDAGKGKDAGKDAGKKDAATVELVNEGDECDPEAYGGLGNYGGACEGCGASQCIAPCEDGVYGECKTAAAVIASFTADGGLGNFLRDSGFSLPDTGIVRTDGGFTIPTGGDGGTVSLTEQECPADYMCDSTLTTFMLPATCVKPGANMVVVFDLPPKCTTNDDCKKLGLTGTCITIPAMGLIPAGSDKVCLAPCKP